MCGRSGVRCIVSVAPARPKGYWNDPDTRRSFWEKVAKERGVERPEDWKNVSRAVVAALGGRGLLKRYGDSVPLAVADAFPELELNPEELRRNRPSGHWLVAENCRRVLEEVKKEVGIVRKEDWKKVVNQDLLRMGHGSMLAKHGNSLLSVLRFAYPEEDWEEAECRAVHGAGYWDNAMNRRAFMEKVAATYGVEKKEDWRRVTNESVIKAGGSTLLRRFNSNVMELLRNVFPEEEWEERDVRPKVAKSYWDSLERRREFLLGIAKSNGWISADGKVDWKGLTYTVLSEEKGTGLLARYGSSVFELLQDTFPEMELTEEDCLQRLPSSHWQEKANRAKFVTGLAEELGLSRPSDWKSVSIRDIQERGGGGLLAFYRFDIAAMLRDVYNGSKEEWSEFNCRRNVKAENWEDRSFVRRFLVYVKDTLRIEKASDWPRIGTRQLMGLGGGGLLATMPLIDALRLAFPEEKWEEISFDGAVKKSCQRVMRVCLTRLYPGVDFMEDYRHPSLGGSDDERRALELDIYFPQLQLAFEFNGQQHYHDVSFFGPVEVYRRRDAEKQRLCEEQGIKLVTVPYWWDQRLESLAASIDDQHEGSLPAPKPDHEEEVRRILKEVSEGIHEAISLTPPTKYVAPQKVSSRAGQATHVWESSQDPTGWLAFPRLTGVRSFWTEEGQLATRRGKRLFPPANWLAQMPKGLALEGDLFAGQEHLGALLHVICEGPAWSGPDDRLSESQRRAKEEAWRKVTFVACDMPGTAQPLRDRFEQIRSLQPTDVFSVAEVTEIESEDHLGQVLEAAGDNGLLLRHPEAVYRYGRVQEAYRVKKMHVDEACMVKKSPHTRALLAETPSGVTQMVRCTEGVYGSPPAPGTVLSVGHFGQWRSGRYKYPFLIATLPDQRWPPVTAE